MKRQKQSAKKGKAAPTKKRQLVYRRGFGDLIFALNKLTELRSAEDYRSAEVQRQNDGSATMAAGTAAQQEAIRMMIGTWESIANMVLDLDTVGQHTIFGLTPVGYMFDVLYPGILIIRQNEPGYASMFEQLDAAYSNWIATKSAEYQSRAAQGLNTNFG